MARGEVWIALLRAVRVHHLQLRHGLIGIVHTADALLTASDAAFVRASGNTAVSQSFVGALRADHDASLTTGGSMIVAAGRDMNVQGGGGGVLLADTVHVTDATIPLVIARDLSASGNTRILLSASQAIALGVAGGITLAVVGFLLRYAATRK